MNIFHTSPHFGTLITPWNMDYGLIKWAIVGTTVCKPHNKHKILSHNRLLFNLINLFHTEMFWEIDLGNSDVWGMQCFCSIVSKMVSKHDRQACSETSLKATLQKHCITNSDQDAREQE